MTIRFVATAAVRPTEDRRKVERAILQIFPEANVTANPTEITAKGDDLAEFAERLRKQMILDTSRGIMLRGRDASGESTRFIIGKQAAYVGRISFITEREHPLGDIHVRFTGDSGEELERAIESMAPDTRSKHYGEETGWDPVEGRFRKKVQE